MMCTWKSTVPIAVLLVLSIMIVPQASVVYAQEQQYFFTLEYDVYTGVIAVLMNAGEILKVEAAKIGINIEIKSMDRATWLAKLLNPNATSSADGGYDFAPSGTDGQIDPAIGPFSVSSALPPAGANIIRLNNGLVDSLVAQLKTELNQTKRIAMGQKILAIYYDEMPNMPLYNTYRFIVSSKDLQNVEPEVVREFLRYAGYWTLAGKTAADDTAVMYGTQMAIVTLSPFFSIESGSTKTVMLAAESLVQYNRGNKSIEPLLAKSWDISADGLNYTFYLRDNAYWHDGVKFTAEDVKFTYQAAADPNVGSVFRSYTTNIKSIEIINDTTVRFVLKTPDSSALAQIFCLNNYGGLVPKHIFDGVNATDYKTHWSNTERIIGTGAYKFVKWVKDDYMEFEKNTQWWGGDPFIDHLFVKTVPDKTACITALQTGEVDILDPMVGYAKEDIPALQNDTNLNVVTGEFGGINVFLLNNFHPILQNKWVRQALSHAFPREHFCTDIVGLGSTPASQYTAPMDWWYNPDLPPIDYNLTYAKECMVKAGYNYDWITPKPVDTMTLYGIPIAATAIGLAVGAPVGYFVKRKRG